MNAEIQTNLLGKSVSYSKYNYSADQMMTGQGTIDVYRQNYKIFFVISDSQGKMIEVQSDDCVLL